MASAAIPNTELDELEAVLKAKVLARSPSVLRIAEYIVGKYVEGEAASLKEYTIAVEALGKPADFDPKRDSIVRVEAHRLRKKLAEFYRTEGADHKLQVVIDPGQYSPRFVSKIQAEGIAETPGANSTELAVPDYPRPSADAARPHLSPPRLKVSKWLILGIASVVSTLAVFVWWVRFAPTPPTAEPVRLLAGAEEALVVVSATGDRWRGDSWFKGGRQVGNGQPVVTSDEVPLNFQRQGDFDYEIPLAKGPYELRLYFAPRIGAAEDRGITAHGFDVLANGIKLLDALDPGVSHHSKSSLVTRVFHDIVPDSSGLLHLSFRSGTKIAYVNAVELTPGETGKLSTIRLIAKAAPYTQPDGVTWAADRYAIGGTLTLRSEHLRGTMDQNLMSGERYGTFEYEIPVSKGYYGVKLYFAETWFGSKLNGGGAGSRRFDVSANGVPLLQDFDIFREAGQRNRLVVKAFHRLTPNVDGYINLEFETRVNNACINALELYDEGP